MSIYKQGKKDLDDPEKVSKKCSSVIADGTVEKVARNLKTKNIKI